MALLFVNACMRAESRTARLARAWLAREAREVEEVSLLDSPIVPLDATNIDLYQRSVAAHTFDDELFAPARAFAAADEIAIAAPVWNFALPARLHDYLEVVCTQGVTFDLDASGSYVGLVRARRLTLIGTSGGPWPTGANDHAFGYIETLAREFWHIGRVERIVADGLDVIGCDVEAALTGALEGRGA